jgi:hypothetical protein
MIKISRISFGGTAAIVTSMALIVGLDAAHAARSTIVSALLIAAVADNLTDSLSVHIYQESERLDETEAFIGTLTNFATRFLLCLTFVLLIATLPLALGVLGAIAWGVILLATLTWMLANQRGVGAFSEVTKHLVVAIAVIAASKGIGYWISDHIA